MAGEIDLKRYKGFVRDAERLLNEARKSGDGERIETQESVLEAAKELYAEKECESRFTSGQREDKKLASMTSPNWKLVTHNGTQVVFTPDQIEGEHLSSDQALGAAAVFGAVSIASCHASKGSSNSWESTGQAPTFPADSPATRMDDALSHWDDPDPKMRPKSTAGRAAGVP